MSKIKLETKHFYGWCTVIIRHFRLIVGKYNNECICQDCLNSLRLQGIQTATQVSIGEVLAPKKAKRKRKANKHNYPTKNQQYLFKKRVLNYLSTGFYTQLEIYENVKHSKKFEQVKRALWEMRRDGEIVAARVGSNSSMVYTTVEREELLKIHLGGNFKDKISDYLEVHGELKINELADLMKRSRSTICHWIDELEKEGVIQTQVRHIKGEHGHSKFCWLKSNGNHRDL
ncbi:MarR family transcriptional regulator [Brasilonema sp. UFV-L1]|uniref:MarR family transcriptional regulator n=1 Tax=Brasilonema sp. UFV-L1 TaxID=2234130 RepID=UPI00145C6C58|nr:MarR family transcriptional regulator [Brasilonema sp. UFV-L1]NMG09778.1 hypothetical protein [Brasilonema sp. UFV-L1]